jgi:hypothetical protein
MEIWGCPAGCSESGRKLVAVIGRLAVVSLVLSLALPFAALGERTAVARLSADSREHDPVFIYEQIHGSFFVENLGTDPFRIANVKSTCACTTTVGTKGAVAPGERAEIRYEMESAAPLRRSVSIFVVTNPPLAEPLRFTAAGTWRPFIEVEEKFRSIQTAFGEPFSLTVPLRSAEGVESIRIVGATTRQKWVELELTESDAGRLPSLVIRSSGGLQPGTHQLGVDIAFETDIAGKQSLKFDVDVQSDFYVSPSPIVTSIDPESPQPPIEFVVGNKQGKRFLIHNVQAERFRIETPDLPETPSAIQHLRVTIAPADGPIPRRGRLLVDLGEDKGILAVDVLLKVTTSTTR